MPAYVQHHFVEAFLQRGCDIPMLASDFILWLAFLHKVIVQIFARSRVILALISREVQSQQRNADGAIRQQLHGFLEESAKALRIPVRGETHDFVFIGVEVETQVERDQRIETVSYTHLTLPTSD